MVNDALFEGVEELLLSVHAIGVVCVGLGSHVHLCHGLSTIDGWSVREDGIRGKVLIPSGNIQCWVR